MCGSCCAPGGAGRNFTEFHHFSVDTHNHSSDNSPMPQTKRHRVTSHRAGHRHGTLKNSLLRFAPRRQQAQPRSVTRGEAVAKNRKQPSDRGRSGGRNNRHRYGPVWHLPRANPSHSGPGSSNRDGLRKRAETKARTRLWFRQRLRPRDGSPALAGLPPTLLELASFDHVAGVSGLD